MHVQVARHGGDCYFMDNLSEHTTELGGGQEEGRWINE